ncbi:MAG: tetratricopeptide repeat protein, partial [Gammaproteobacteria bacterium]
QLRGQLFVTKRKIHDAKKDYEKAIELKPDYSNAHYNLALLYDIYLQEMALAIKHYETYLSLIKKPDEATQEWVNHLKGVLANG